jgi:hypothetical protein
LGPYFEYKLLDQGVRRENAGERNALLFKELMMNNLGKRVILPSYLHREALLILAGRLYLHFA